MTELKDRPTKELQIGEHKIVIKTYATGREFNEIQGVYLRSAKVNVVGSAPQMTGFSADISLDADKKGLEMLLVSVNGQTTGLADIVLDFPKDVYQQVVEAVNEVLAKKN